MKGIFPVETIIINRLFSIMCLIIRLTWRFNEFIEFCQLLGHLVCYAWRVEFLSPNYHRSNPFGWKLGWMLKRRINMFFHWIFFQGFFSKPFSSSRFFLEFSRHIFRKIFSTHHTAHFFLELVLNYFTLS